MQSRVPDVSAGVGGRQSWGGPSEKRKKEEGQRSRSRLRGIERRRGGEKAGERGRKGNIAEGARHRVMAGGKAPGGRSV